MKKILLFILIPLQLSAQSNSFLPYKKYPFTTELCASASGSKIAWALNEQGKRNVYIACGPDFNPIRLTDFLKDDGQEITSLSISADGNWIVFVRGGDHSGNFNHDMPVNPAADLNAFKVQVIAVPFAGGKPKYLSEGDTPAISIKNHAVAFINNGQVWLAPIDGSKPSKNLFNTKGNVNSIQWSPDEKYLLFVTNRVDHAIIGIYNYISKAIKWIVPSFGIDVSPCWSSDGNKIAFIRMRGSGGEPDSMLVNQKQPWSIYVADIATNKATLLWKAPSTLPGSFPQTGEKTTLYWAANNNIVFLSYHDGWQHLYSVPAGGGKVTLLTPGNFMVENVTLSYDKKHLTFNGNTGNDVLDIERRHAGIVSVGKADMQVVTQGTGLEWAPVTTGDNKTFAVISATAQRPPLPAVINSDKGTLKVLGTNLIPADFPQSIMIIPKQVLFRSADGLMIHADLFEPADRSIKHPAIVYLHGGPARQMLLGWHYFDYYANAYACNQYLANLGFVVLSVNYRLGIGYGYALNQPEKAGPAGASEYQDIKSAGEWLQQQSYVDAAKIGIYGGSYGGYLTALALARDSKIFAAGVDIHGVHDWISDLTLNIYSGKYEKAPDYDKAIQTAWLSSPVSSISTWHSPVLIIHGDDDRNVPFNQSVDLINRLEKKGVPYETMMIIDDTHHWMNFNNSVKVYNAVADFFLRHLK